MLGGAGRAEEAADERRGEDDWYDDMRNTITKSSQNREMSWTRKNGGSMQRKELGATRGRGVGCRSP
eukprot:415844-Hanusia_phi.AAC.5